MLAGVSFAAPSEEWRDQDGDGFKETHLFIKNDLPDRAEYDRNKDGKPDQFLEFKNGLRSTFRASRRFDGRIDQWKWYDAKGCLSRDAKDSNHDGTPDRFSYYPNGNRETVIRELDRNFDGKIDKRVLSVWDGEGKMKVYTGTRMQSIAHPGYKTMRREEDKDFDGKIDKAFDRKDKTFADRRKGQPISPEPSMPDASSAEEESTAPSGSKKGISPSEALLKRQNERYGF